MPSKKFTVAVLVPCYNEERAVEACIQSCLRQKRPFDQIVFVNDSSKDATPDILARYADKITAVCTPKNTGNKSSAQEYGLQFVKSDIVVMTDADTVLDPQFCGQVHGEFLRRPDIVAMAGYVKSMPHNWLTLCRAFEYLMGQNIHKLAQHYIGHIFVMPGAACAFRTPLFGKEITFDHDTITEDLDFTYKMHRQSLPISYNAKAISYTQDPADLHNYINQIRRWFGGGWQNLVKHWSVVPKKPSGAFEVSILYAEGIIFSILLFILPVLNLWLFVRLIGLYMLMTFMFAIWAAIREKRPAFLLAPLPYLMLNYIHAYVFLEQGFKEVVLRQKNLVWFKPERIVVELS